VLDALPALVKDWRARAGEPSERKSIPDVQLTDCSRPGFANGYCTLHHARWQKHGDPHVGVARPRYQPILRGDGYVWVWQPEHPRAHQGRVPEHRLVMERELKRLLLPGENVHHINGNRRDNRPENLELWVVHQPKGQRPEDLVEWANEILRRYA
jgi:hypothetical protein